MLSIVLPVVDDLEAPMLEAGVILTRIPQLNRKCRKRGAILEQRRRPTVKFQSHFALSHVVAMRLNLASKHR
jgi:hypothetical protein